jgi:hypothetical protein
MLRRVPSSTAPTLTPWIGIPLGSMDVCLFFLCMLSYVGIGFAAGRSPVQGIVPNVYKYDSETRKTGRIWGYWSVVP